MTTVSSTPTTHQAGSSAGEDSRPDGRMGGDAQKDFREELNRLKANAGAGPRDSVVRVFGVALMVIGLLVIFLAYNLTHSASDIRDQMEMLTIAALGVAVSFIGSVLYAVTTLMRFMRFWLLRVIYEQRDLALPHDRSASVADALD